MSDHQRLLIAPWPQSIGRHVEAAIAERRGHGHRLLPDAKRDGPSRATLGARRHDVELIVPMAQWSRELGWYAAPLGPAPTRRLVARRAAKRRTKTGSTRLLRSGARSLETA